MSTLRDGTAGNERTRLNLPASSIRIRLGRRILVAARPESCQNLHLEGFLAKVPGIISPKELALGQKQIIL